MPATGQAKQFDDFIVRRGTAVDAGFVYRLLPVEPSVAHVLRHGSAPVPRAEAVDAPYINLNSETHVNWLTVDIDRATTVDELLDAIELLGLPYPAFAVRNEPGKNEGRLHATWCLATPVQRGPRAAARPLAYFARIRRALGRALGADPGFTNTLVKNPLARGTNEKPTRTHWLGGRPVDLHEIADRLDLAEPARRRRADRGRGRNSNVFSRASGHAYDIVAEFRRGAGRHAFETEMRAHCEMLNAGFARPMGLREVHGIARSIARWTWDNYRRPRAGTSADGRRRQGARRVVARRAGVLALAFERIRTGRTAEAASLAAETGVPLRTVQRYLRILRARLAAAPRIPPSGSVPAAGMADGGVVGTPAVRPRTSGPPRKRREPTGSG